jgi:hypothetical protein
MDMRERAKPRVKDYREITPESDALRRQLQAELGVSANRLAELAYEALAADRERRRTAETT